jgi:hypothetical protein
MDPEKDDRDLVEKLIDKALHELGEHCDSVRIFTTERGDSPGITSSMSKGVGNFYAQKGQVQAWLVQENERLRAEVWEELDDPEGGGENP